MFEKLLHLLRNRLVLASLAVLVAAGVYYGFFAGGGTGDVTYETQAVDRGEVDTSVASSGAVSPLQTVTVGSEVSGKLIDVYVDFNARVTKGQSLAQIDNSTFKSKMQSAEADLVVQQATIGSREVDVSNAQVNLDQAKRDFDRAVMLFEKGLASALDKEKAQNTHEQAQNSLKIAKANYNNARSQLVKVRANVDQARIDLGRTLIISPVDGVVINRKVDPGQTVAASMQAPELFLVAMDLSQIRIETKVDEADIGTIKEGARATFTVDAFPDRTFEGKVSQVRINGTTAQNVVTYSVMVQATNPGQVLLPGMTANVRIITNERSNVLRVASSALRFRPPGASGAALPDVAANRAGGAAAGAGAGGNGGQAGNRGGQNAGGGPNAGGGQRGATGTGQRAGGRGRQTVQLTPEVMTELGLSAEQQERVTAAMAELTQRTAGNQNSTSSPLGGNMGNFRGMMGNNNDAALMRQRIQNALGNILTEEQMAKYQAMGSSTAARNGTVYVLNANGEPEAKTVRIGLASDSSTEVIAGLAEGDKVIIRARTTTPS
jgi:HlyD family secretion protein